MIGWDDLTRTITTVINGGSSLLVGILVGRGEDGGASHDRGDGYNLQLPTIITTRMSMS
jgi:hypothetical protein